MKIQSMALFLFTCGVATLSFADGYKVQNKILIGGVGGWDYLAADADARRLYVSHGAQVEVIDLDSLKPVGKIADTPGVHGIAIAPALGVGFISEGKADAVAVFDLKTLKKTGEIKTEKNPDSILFDPATTHVFANNGRSNSSSVIDPANNTVVATIPLPGKPEFAAADGKGHVFVNIEDKNSLARIDARSLTVDKTWALTGCESPSSMAMDTASNRLFIGCGNKVMAVVDAENGNVVTTLPIGDHVDATVFDAQKKLVFNSNGDGTLTIISEDSPDKFHVVENVPTQKGARTVALDSKTHRVFLSVANFGPTPAPATPNERVRPPVLPDTFTVLVVEK